MSTASGYMFCQQKCSNSHVMNIINDTEYSSIVFLVPNNAGILLGWQCGDASH